MAGTVVSVRVVALSCFVVFFATVVSEARATEQNLSASERVSVNGATLAYDTTGKGPLVVLIGGGGTLDRRMWDEQVAAMSSRYTVLRYDVRGIGGSSRPEGPFSHSEDLNALLRTLDAPPACVVGLSFGAGIAVDLALDHPSRVRCLVLASPGLSSDKDDNLKGALAAAELARKNGLASVVDAIVRSPSLLASENASTRERVREIYLDQGDVFESDFALIRLWRPTEPPARERLSAIRVPTLILTGEHDAEPVHDTAEELTAGIAGAEAVVVPGAGHLSNLDAPRAFNESVLSFLEGVR